MTAPNARFAAVPADLRGWNQWVCWSSAKVPKIAGTVRNASVREPRTWSAFAACVAALRARPGCYLGLGFVFAVSDPFCGIDLDGCMDPETGEVTGGPAKGPLSSRQGTVQGGMVVASA